MNLSSLIIILITIIFIAVFAVLLIKLLQILKNQKRVKTNEYHYIKLKSLFTPAEQSFLGVLNQAVGDNAKIFGKVRVADVMTPKKGMSRGEWQKAFNKISGKHFDYLLCNKNNMSVLCAIELNDSSHNSKKRRDRDKFLEYACQSAQIPLIQVPAKSTYNVKEIQNYIVSYFPAKSFQPTANAPDEFEC